MNPMRALALLTVLAASIVVPGSALAAAPTNDAFAQAINISADSGEASGSNVDATKEAGEPDHAGNAGGASVWFRWTAARAGRVVLSSCDSDFDTVLAVYTGTSVSSLAPVASRGDCDATPRIEFLPTPGVDYHIALDGKDGATGDFFLYFFQRPANDDRERAEPIAGDSGLADISNRYGSLEQGEAEHGGPGGASVWFRWTAPSSGPVRFDTCRTGYDTLLGVYEAGATTPFATNDDHCGYGSVVGFSAEAGKNYLIAVDGYSGGWVGGPLAWSRSAVEPTNVERPTISGTPQESSTLTTSDGTWAGTPPFAYTYAWARCNAAATFCEFVPGANGRTYNLTASDVTFRIRAFVTATNAAGSGQMNSGATAPVAPRPAASPRNLASPGVSGAAVVDGVLTASSGTWDGYPPPNFSFQWESCAASGSGCVEIPGEIDPTIRLSQGEVGRRIRVAVVAQNMAGAASAHSAPTDVVQGPRQPSAARCVVPNVRGKTLLTARSAIRRGRCAVGRITSRFSGRARVGRVISQTPRAGRRLPIGSKVNLVVRKGRRR